ncbi:hypothetical protein WBP07_18300 [Novosphingobium sp. BL-8A]
MTDWESGQRRLASAVNRWRSNDAVAPVLAALGRFADGAAINDCPSLGALFRADPEPAEKVLDSFVHEAVAAMAAIPLGQLPLRHAHRRAAHTLLLAREREASLAVTVYDGAALSLQPAPRSADFAPVETWLRVVSGTGSAALVARNPVSAGPLDRAEVVLRPGDVIHRDGRTEALRVRAAEGTLVVLRLQRPIGAADAACEFALDDGAILNRAAARVEDSRLELAISVLVAQGRRDAVPALGRIVGGSGAAALRWSALRGVLGLDTRAGMVLLGELADGDDAALGAAARALRSDFLKEWPELEKVTQWRG